MSYGDWIKAGEPALITQGITSAMVHEYAKQMGDPEAKSIGAGAARAEPAGVKTIAAGQAQPTPGGQTQPQAAPPALKPAEGGKFQIQMTPVVQPYVNDEIRRLDTMSKLERDAQLAENIKRKNMAEATRDASYRATDDLNGLMLPLVTMAADAKIEPGIFAPIVANATRGFNYIVSQIGLPQEFQYAEKSVNQYELAKKAEVALAAAKAAGADMRAIDSLRRLAEGMANPNQTAGTARQLLASTFIENQKALEEASFNYRYATQPNAQEYTLGQNASQAWKDYMPPEEYKKQEAAVRDLMTKKLNDGTPWLEYLLGKGKDEKLQKQDWAKLINQHYGFDISRIFLNTVK
jgi:hypothetical protein